MRALSLFTAVTSIITVTLAGPAAAAPDSAYTKIDYDKDCTVTDKAGDDGGDWAELLCPGYKGYPVYLSYSDARDSVYYGYAPEGGPPRWESFGVFNSVGGTIEWRLEKGIPFATIHRWSVAQMRSDGTEGEIQVLVVEKVGQPDTRDGCVAGYVVATGNPDANVQARQVADKLLDGFDCAGGVPEIRAGSVPLPTPTVHDM